MYDDYARDYFGSDKVKTFACNVNSNELGEVDFDNIDSFDYKLGLQVAVIISDEICDNNKCRDFSQSLMDYSRKLELVGNYRITVLKDVDISQLNYYNHTNYYDLKYLLYNFHIIFDDTRADIYEGN
jgi:hypothetical protein